MPHRLMEPRLPLGKVYSPATTAERLEEETLLQILHRHHCGDWGDLVDGDKRVNEEALQTDELILSRYNLERGSFYIITKADRSVTTLMDVEEGSGPCRSPQKIWDASYLRSEFVSLSQNSFLD